MNGGEYMEVHWKGSVMCLMEGKCNVPEMGVDRVSPCECFVWSQYKQHICICCNKKGKR
jgi:hypothetical protein